MSVHADHWIRRMALERGMIEPFEEKLVRRSGEAPIISYGLSSYGYDLRVADEFKVFTNVFNAVVDPKAFDDRSFVDIRGESCLVPPNSFALARSMEYFRIPRDVLSLCVGKSTYARCGIIVNVTPFEPEWEGHVTLEISNTTPSLPAFTRARGWRKCSSCLRRSLARRVTPTVAGNIRPSAASPRRVCEPWQHASHASYCRQFFSRIWAKARHTSECPGPRPGENREPGAGSAAMRGRNPGR